MTTTSHIDQLTIVKMLAAGKDFTDIELDYSLVNQERWGIWGGLSERERNRLLKGAA